MYNEKYPTRNEKINCVRVHTESVNAFVIEWIKLFDYFGTNCLPIKKLKLFFYVGHYGENVSEKHLCTTKNPLLSEAIDVES